MTIRIVTDSTSDLPEEVISNYGITVLPAYINIGDRSYLDGVELTRQEFYERLPGMAQPPTTAAPAVGAFKEAYERLAAEGATQILSIHVAANLSGMLNAARLGAEEVQGVEIELFDSRQLTMGLGLLTLTAARAASAGRTLDEIVALLSERVQRTHVLAVLDTLEYLRRSGRVSWAQFGLGTLLQIKPIIHVYDGDVSIPERVRTRGRALDHLVDRVTALGPLEELTLLHTANPEGVADLSERAEKLIPAAYTPYSVEVTPTIGAHVGPGGLGFALIAAEAPSNSED